MKNSQILIFVVKALDDMFNVICGLFLKNLVICPIFHDKDVMNTGS